MAQFYQRSFTNNNLGPKKY